MNHADSECSPAERLSWWELWPMLGWGVFVVYLYFEGRMIYFLRPAYGYLAVAGGVLLLAIFAYGWFLRWRSLRHEAASERAPPRPPSVWYYVQSLAFLVPLVIGFSLPQRGLNALAALQRGAGDPAALAQLAAQRQTEKAKWERGYAWTTVLGVAQRLGSQEPQKVGALGFVLRDNKTPTDGFLLVRFLITCCAADASPVAVPVRWPDAHTLENNQWVKVYGRIDPQAKVLVADDIQPTRQPKRPYL